MARAYSLDLRERVVAAVLRGLSCRAVAVRFDVSVASVVKWAQRARETGSPAARPMGGKRPYLLAGQRSWLLARLDEKPDLTLHTLLRELGAPGVTVSCDTNGAFCGGKVLASKKASRPASKSVLMSLAGGPYGSVFRHGLHPSVSSFSTRLGQRPICRHFGDGAGAAKGSMPRFLTAIGKP